MAEFIETHTGGKAPHYEGYTYAKIRMACKEILSVDARNIRVAAVVDLLQKCQILQLDKSTTILQNWVL